MMYQSRFPSTTFHNISEEKQNTVLKAAQSEFARRGYSAASINTIAKQAGISIGSMYSYFPSKEALFLTIIDGGRLLLQEALDQVVQKSGTFFDKMHLLLEESVSYARQYPEMNQIYLELSTEGLAHLASQLSTTMEKISTEVYRDLIRQAKERGEIRPEIDEQVLAFSLDNTAVMLQFSFASNYYWERLKLFFPNTRCNNPEELIDSICHLFQKSLTP
ncbi:MAG: TetR/AcrR family transcriptional regulator [Spirochaetota bacterium]